MKIKGGRMKMKNKRKKLFSILLSTGLIAGVLAGCSGGEESISGGSEEKQIYCPYLPE